MQNIWPKQLRKWSQRKANTSPYAIRIRISPPHGESSLDQIQIHSKNDYYRANYDM